MAQPPSPGPVLLLDGGIGRELEERGVPLPPTIRSAAALLSAPDVVRQIHADYIAAGADVITVNSYGLARPLLAREGLERQLPALAAQACRLAIEARHAAGRPVLIAGAIGPLHGTLEPSRDGRLAETIPLYREVAEALAPHVDLLLCETMCSCEEGRAAATAACATGRPVWVAWSLRNEPDGRLRSGEAIGDAVAALHDLPVGACLLNCCRPESVAAALPALRDAAGGRPVGGYANAMAEPRRNGGGTGGYSYRGDLDPHSYAEHASRWLLDGAGIVGGCCGIGPRHIAHLHRQLAARSSTTSVT